MTTYTILRDGAPRWQTTVETTDHQDNLALYLELSNDSCSTWTATTGTTTNVRTIDADIVGAMVDEMVSQP